eukprot:1256136-Amphidinium_carterae.1
MQGHVCAYATRRRRFIPDPSSQVSPPMAAKPEPLLIRPVPKAVLTTVQAQHEDKENQLPAAPSRGVHKKAEVARPRCYANAAVHIDGLPLLTVPGLREAFPITPREASRGLAEAVAQPHRRSSSAQAAYFRESTEAHCVKEAAPAARVQGVKEAALADVTPDVSREEAPIVARVDRQGDKQGLSAAQLVTASSASNVIRRLGYTVPLAELDEEALSAADELLTGPSLGSAVERAVMMELAEVDSNLSLPDSASSTELEYKGHVGALLKLVGKRALERTLRHVHLAPASRFSAVIEALHEEEGRGVMARASGVSSVGGESDSGMCCRGGASTQTAVEAPWQQLKRLMYEDACARLAQHELEEELGNVQKRLE